MSIEVQNLLKIYGSQKAVNHISFRVGRGEIVGFLGPNGAGKSTTMKILTGYLRADEGEATVSGINVHENPIGVKKRIGYLPESNALYHDMFVREYLSFIASLHELDNRKKAVETAIGMVGLQPESSKKIGQLSKGYKQRVGLAAALIHDPEVLILDEPTSGLDPNQIVEIREVIRRQGADKTVLFSSHILQEVEAICDRVIIINRGSLVADDRLSNLAKQKRTNIVRVSFKETLEAEWLSRLGAVRSVNRVDATTWSLDTDEPELLRKQLLEMSLQHNLNIVSLQSESTSLEEIFRSLTQEQAGS
jgi:ABC-2 type transport system ATP-binding protein